MAKFRKSYAQVAEDLLAAFFLKKEDNVTYIDVGCLWPIQHSNTYYFYERGGVGLCIDPNPDIADDFRSMRPRDVFVNCGVGSSPGQLLYHQFENPVFNTFVADRANELNSSGRPGRKQIAKISVPLRPLSEIVLSADWNGRFGKDPDILSVDVEGFEASVIDSLDLTYLRPRLIILEIALKKLNLGPATRCISDLQSNGYEICGDTGHDVFLFDGKHRSNH